MSGIDELKTILSLPPVSQIGVVVREIERAVSYFSSIFGIGPFTVYDWTPDKHWVREEPSYLKLRMGKTMWGDVELELI
jgi:hypothetical protein